jgi:competence protein ComEA
VENPDENYTEKTEKSNATKETLVTVALVAAVALIVLASTFVEKNAEKSQIHYYPNTSESTADSSSFYSEDLTETVSEEQTTTTTAKETVTTTASSLAAEDSSSETLQTFTFPVDVNLVTFDELCAIDGIGERTAEKILAFRNSVGRITSLEQLSEISGIGDKTVQHLREYLYVSDSDYVPYDDGSQDTAETLPEEEQPVEIQTETEFPETQEVQPNEENAAEEQTLTCVHINYASAEEISSALLISEEAAEDIVSLRSQIGYFSSIEELTLTDSLSASEISSLKEYIIID